MVRAGAVLGWSSGVGALALLLGQFRFQVLHPHPAPLILLIVSLVVSTGLSVLGGTWGIIKGPLRIATACWTAGAVLPFLLMTSTGAYALLQFRERRVPNDLPMNLAKTAAASFARAEISTRYAHRHETKRLVMFYNVLDRPQEDAEAMDSHLAALEKKLGGTLRAKVYWVRGDSHLMSAGGPDLVGLSFAGIAFGTSASPRDWNRDGSLDRHELAHAAIDEFRDSDADPPFLLHEGWAVARSGVGSEILAIHALETREENPRITVRSLLEPDEYHRIQAEDYPLGGAFVDFLIRKHGVSRFLQLYQRARPATFDATCRDLFGSGLDSLEDAFWKDAKALSTRVSYH